MIAARGLTKRIGTKQILRGIDLEIGTGEFVTCFGPNGAGKTTTLMILAMLSKPSGGQVLIDGYDIQTHGQAVRRKIGVISHNSFLYNNLTARENLLFYGKMYEVEKLNSRVDDLLEQVGLTYVADEPVFGFSRGMQQRLSIARSLVHNPPVLLMDEPYTGLDEMAKGILDKLIKQLAQTKHTFFLITHDFDQGLGYCDQTLILAAGRIVYTGNPNSLNRDEFRRLYLESVGGIS